jgi:hypothetical protein
VDVAAVFGRQSRQIEKIDRGITVRKNLSRDLRESKRL